MNGVAMKVFVSHIAEEAALATILKDWIESTFLGQADVFVSERDISSGEQWFRRLEEELTDAKVMLVLCSARSVSMPWINFETGAGHIKGIPIIPKGHPDYSYLLRGSYSRHSTRTLAFLPRA